MIKTLKIHFWYIKTWFTFKVRTIKLLVNYSALVGSYQDYSSPKNTLIASLKGKKIECKPVFDKYRKDQLWTISRTHGWNFEQMMYRIAK